VSTSQQTDPLIGRLVDSRYRVRARIARGGMATVYVATDLRLERRVALKVMHGHLSDDSVFQSRFIQEARAAARLADPHVVNVFDQGQDGDMAYLVMEYLPGITLRELLKEQRRLTVPQAISIMDAILSGLAAAHRAGIVHRDVKPENVLLAEDGRIKIGDFGLARATTANTATGAQLLGTIAYLAPELVTRGTADARSDIYALGIVLYEMLAGEQPYKGEQPMQIAYQHATDSVPRPSVKNPGVPEQLDELVLWSTEKLPDDRPLDAREMLERLREIERELGVTPQVARTVDTGVTRDESGASGELTKVLPAAVTGPTDLAEDVDNTSRLRQASKRRSRKGAWLLGVVVILTALAGAAGWWFGSGPGSQVAVPDLSGLTFDQAQGALAEESLTGVEEGVFSLEVDSGLIVDTEPEAGARVDKDTEVTVLVSLGPAEVALTGLNGQPETDVRAQLDASRIDVGENQTFYTDADEGVVVGVVVTPRGGADPVECGEECTVNEGDSASLRVSLGPLPSVRDMTEADARATLEAAGIDVASVAQESSTEIAEGRVLYMTDREGGGWWRPGDRTNLVVSSGPPLFPVPDVVGMTRDAAADALRAEGFEVNYSALWNVWPDAVTEVTAQDPEGSSMRVQGTTVTLQITVTG
tara:strand:- start:329 stop:2266 length:1938 start_codon:yes stop_codon:yes gene_type:complete